MSSWPAINGATVKYVQDAENPNFVLYVQRDGKWCVWDRVWASSEEAATLYFDSKYRSVGCNKYRKEIRKVLPC